MTKLINWIFVVLIIGTAAACNSVETSKQLITEASPDQDLDAISKTRNAYMSAWKAGSADLIRNVYTDDAVVLYPGQPAVTGRNAIYTYFQDFFNNYVQVTFELNSQEVEIAGAWAFDRGTFKWKGIPRNGGDSIEDFGKYLVILQRQPDSSWKVARDMDNSDQPLTQKTRGIN